MFEGNATYNSCNCKETWAAHNPHATGLVELPVAFIDVYLVHRIDRDWPWLVELTVAFIDVYLVRRIDRDWPVSSATYLPALDPPHSAPHTISYHKSQLPRNDVSFDKDVVRNVLAILHEWFNIPQDSTHLLIQSWFVHILHSALGPGCFLLPKVWALYSKAPSWLTCLQRNSRANVAALEAYKELEDAIKSLPAAERLSPECISLSDLQQHHVNLVNVSSQRQSRNGGDDGPAITVDISPETAVNIVVKLLRNTLAANSIPPAQNEATSKILEDSDNYLALREHAVSRRIILSDPSPYADNVIITNAGLLSALYFRGRSFRSAALLKSPTHL